MNIISKFFKKQPENIENTEKILETDKFINQNILPDQSKIQNAIIDNEQLILCETNNTNVEEHKGWLNSLKNKLSKTRNNLGKRLLSLFGGGKIDDELYEELETILLSSDVGSKSTKFILEEIKNKVSLKGLKDSVELKETLTNILIDLLATINKPFTIKEQKPYVIMLVGINGAGKTTTIGKLTKYFQLNNKSVILAAADTFRAAAREQLMEWGNRNNVTVISQINGDPASVAYDTIKSAIANKIDVVLIDTAGRLTTQTNLMEEIKKIKRVVSKALDSAPHEILLTLDSNIGQNALNQLLAFDEAIGVTGLVVTKLDGTAKGGIVCAIAKEHPIPVVFIGVGEKIDDLRPFEPKEYVNALLND